MIASLMAQNTDSYSHTGMDGVVLAEKDTWYLEEFDRAGRPLAAVRWEKGVISETISWQYYGDSQRVYKSQVKSDTRLTETEYDSSGNIILINETLLEEKVQPVKPDRIFIYSYDAKNRLRESVSQRSGSLQKIIYDYRDDGSLSKKHIYKNGLLTLIYAYKDEENWTETVYHNDLAILTVVFQNGERKRVQHETW